MSILIWSEVKTPKVDGGRDIIWTDEQSLLQSIDGMLVVSKRNVVKRKLQKTSMKGYTTRTKDTYLNPNGRIILIPYFSFLNSPLRLLYFTQPSESSC